MPQHVARPEDLLRQCGPDNTTIPHLGISDNCAGAGLHRPIVLCGRQLSKPALVQRHTVAVAFRSHSSVLRQLLSDMQNPDGSTACAAAKHRHRPCQPNVLKGLEKYSAAHTYRVLSMLTNTPPLTNSF